MAHWRHGRVVLNTFLKPDSFPSPSQENTRTPEKKPQCIPWNVFLLAWLGSTEALCFSEKWSDLQNFGSTWSRQSEWPQGALFLLLNDVRQSRFFWQALWKPQDVFLELKGSQGLIEGMLWRQNHRSSCDRTHLNYSCMFFLVIKVTTFTWARSFVKCIFGTPTKSCEDFIGWNKFSVLRSRFCSDEQSWVGTFGKCQVTWGIRRLARVPSTPMWPVGFLG